tara:strand:- start:330 stop:539 length:210 start_codon:yes stop_codon:yes gene_type:complete
MPRKSERRKTDPKTQARRKHHLIIGQAEFRAACDARMREAGMPVNHIEERALKEAIKANRAERKGGGDE